MPVSPEQIAFDAAEKALNKFLKPLKEKAREEYEHGTTCTREVVAGREERANCTAHETCEKSDTCREE